MKNAIKNPRNSSLPLVLGAAMLLGFWAAPAAAQESSEAPDVTTDRVEAAEIENESQEPAEIEEVADVNAVAAAYVASPATMVQASDSEVAPAHINAADAREEQAEAATRRRRRRRRAAITTAVVVGVAGAVTAGVLLSESGPSEAQSSPEPRCAWIDIWGGGC